MVPLTNAGKTSDVFKAPVENFGYPGDYCCALYTDSNFLGNTKTLCHDPANEESYFNLVSIGFNDKLSSFSCGQKVSYTFCKDTNYDCNHDDRASGAGTILSHEMRHNDWATYFKMKSYDPFTLGAVTTFNWNDC